MKRLVVSPTIVEPTAQIGVVLGVFIMALTIGFGLIALAPAVAIFALPAATVVSFVLGARLFRGREEDRRSRRPLWQLTSQPLTGWILCGLCALMSAASLINTGTVTDANPPVAMAVWAAIFVGFAGLYAHSSHRLARARRSEFPQR